MKTNFTISKINTFQKNALLICLIMLFNTNSWGQILVSNFTGTNPGQNGPWSTTSTLNSNLTFVTGVSLGTSTTGAAANNRFSTANYQQTTLANSITNGRFITFSIKANSGYTLNLANQTVVITIQASGTGVTNCALLTSIDGFSAANAIGSSSGLQNTTSTGLTYTFGSGSQYNNINSSTTVEFRIYGWGATAAGGTMSLNALTVNGTLNSSGTPSIAISNQHPSATNINQGSTNNILGIYQLDVTTANATLTGISNTTAGSYAASDIQTNGFKYWINSTANLSGASLLGTSAAVGNGGNVAVSGLTQTINLSTTRYILVTADIDVNAVTSRTISLAATSFANITFSGSVNKTGLPDPVIASNAMTINACTPTNVTGASASNGNTQSVVSWTNANCQDEVMIVAATATNSGTPTGNGSLYTGNLIFGSGTALDNGFVVYKGNTSPQTITGLTNGTPYFFKIFTRRGTTWTSGVEVTATPAQVTTATDFFRSNVTTGTWATAASWQSSNDNTNWITSTLVPTSTANAVTIRNGHTITVGSTATIDQVVVESGGVLVFSSASVVVNDGTGDDIIIQNGGAVSYANAGFSYNSGATININTGGVLNIDVSGITNAGAAIHQTSHIYNTGSILSYNLTSQPSSSSITYFPNVSATTIPIFRFTQNLAGAVGASNPTIFNGLMQYGSGVTSFSWSGTGAKTFRNGIVALGTTTVTATGGNLQIGDASAGTAEIGGAGSLTISSTGGMSITANCTATLSNNISFTSGTLTNNGSLTCGINTITGAGNFTQVSGATIITSNTGGIPTTIGVGGTRTFSAAGANYTFNGATTTPFISGGSTSFSTINTNANVTNNIAGVTTTITTALNINSGTFALNSAAASHLSLSNTSAALTIASGATFDNGGENQISLSGGSPTITINGTFITKDAQGFTGTGSAIPSITPTLGSGSTVVYGLNGNQDVTNFSYQNITFSGSGIKATSGAISSITGTATINSGVTLNAGTSTFGGSLTNLTMLGTSKFITGGSSTTPDATGTYNLANASTIEFSGSSATIIRSSPTYANIDITGSNVSLSGNSTTITLQSGSTFTVKNAGTFNVRNTNGFTGANNTAISNTNNPSITLENGSTINYNGIASQTITNRNDYKGFKCSGGVSRDLTFDLSVAEALTLTTSTDILGINGNTLTLAGSIAGSGFLKGSNTSKINISSTTNAGTINFDQSTSADVATINGTNALQSFVQTGVGGSITFGNKINLFNRLSVSAGTLNTGDNLVLRSTASNTSFVDNVGGIINGQAIVERFYHKNFRGWRMVTAPVTYVGIGNGTIDNVFNNWQSNFGYAGNYGTQVNANVAPTVSNGLDPQTNSSTLLTYNSNGAGSWNRVVNTKTELISGSTGSADNKGYFMFVRGDRTVNPGVTNTWVQTTLAAKGLLQTGAQNFNYTGTAGTSWIVGNPYACPVDMSTVIYNNIPNAVYVWDPNLTGISANSPGAYTAFDRGNWAAGPLAGFTSRFFQSGQAFLVKPSSASAGIVFNESNKSTSANNNTNTTGAQNGLVDLFNVRLYAVQPDGSKTNVDGLRAKYGSNFLAGLDADDILKLTGSLENISLLRGANNFALEARPYITSDDSLFMKMTNMAASSNYEFIVNPINFDPSVTDCKLVDKFLQTETVINLNVNTTVPFSITSVAGSNAADRFYFVFKGSNILSVNSIVAKAAKKANNVEVSFTTTGEKEVKNFNVEKSLDGRNFEKAGVVGARNNNSENTYTFNDNKPTTVNFYRVAAINNNGTTQYSNIVKVEMVNKVESAVKVYPNPVEGNVINLQMKGVAEGKATLNIFNNLGQLVLTQNVNVANSTSTISVELIKTLTCGSYKMTINDAKGNYYIESLLKISK